MFLSFMLIYYGLQKNRLFFFSTFLMLLIYTSTLPCLSTFFSALLSASKTCPEQIASEFARSLVTWTFSVNNLYILFCNRTTDSLGVCFQNEYGLKGSKLNTVFEVVKRLLKILLLFYLFWMSYRKSAVQTWFEVKEINI